MPATPDAAGGRAAEKDERDLHGQEQHVASADTNPASVHGLRAGYAERHQRHSLRPDQVRSLL